MNFGIVAIIFSVVYFDGGSVPVCVDVMIIFARNAMSLSRSFFFLITNELKVTAI